MYLCVHVDDGLVMSNSEEFIADFLEIFLKEVNEIRIFKPIQKYLGIEVKEEDNRIHVSQSKYILEEINLLGIGKDSKMTQYPMSSNTNLHTASKDPSIDASIWNSSISIGPFTARYLDFGG